MTRFVALFGKLAIYESFMIFKRMKLFKESTIKEFLRFCLSEPEGIMWNQNEFLYILFKSLASQIVMHRCVNHKCRPSRGRIFLLGRGWCCFFHQRYPEEVTSWVEAETSQEICHHEPATWDNDTLHPDVDVRRRWPLSSGRCRQAGR